MDLLIDKLIESRFSNIREIDLTTQIKLVNNDRFIRSLLMETSNYIEGRGGFNFFIDQASYEILSILLNSNSFISELSKSPKRDIAIRGLLLSRNSNIADILSYSLLTNYIVENFQRFSTFIDSMNSEVAVSIFKYIYDNCPSEFSLIVHLNENNQLEVIKFIGYVNFYKMVLKDSTMFEYLDENVISVLICDNPFKEYLLNLDDDEVIKYIKRDIKLPQEFTNNSRFINILKNMSDVNEYRFLIMHINDISYNNIKRRNRKRYKLSMDYFRENSIPIEDKQAVFYKNDSVLSRDNFIKLFQDFKVEEEREKYYDKRVDSLNEIFSEYKLLLDNFTLDSIDSLDKNINIKQKLRELYRTNPSKDELVEVFQELTSRELFEILIDRNFKDVPYNFIVNLENVINFFSTKDLSKFNLTNDEIIGLRERLVLYNSLIYFFDLTITEQVNLYKLFLTKDNNMMHFYEDFKLAQKISYTDYNNVVFDPKKETSKVLLNKELSSQGVDVYELKGEKFYVFSHVTDIKRKESIKKYSLWEDKLDTFLLDPSTEVCKTFGSSISLSSHNKMESFRKIQEYVTFGFCNLNPNRFAHVYHADSYSWYFDRGVGMKKINELETSEDLLAKTRRYNEILYQEIGYFLLDKEVLNKYEHFNPSYLLCYDEITLWDIDIAKRMNIPILLIRTEYYNMELDDYNDYNNHNEYIDNEREGFSAVYKRK